MATVQTKNHYATLGVAETATTDEIRKAYRALAHQYHPDKTGGDEVAETKLKEINEAYDVLKNKEKRAQYDQERAYAKNFSGFHGGFRGNAQGFDAGGFADIFGDMFGGRPQQRAPRKGDNLAATLTVTLKDIAHGTTKNLQIRREAHCDACHGSGGAPGTTPVACSTCNGQGVVNRGNGMFTMASTCPTCHGQGERYASPCSSCSGSGRTRIERRIEVRVPVGTAEGTRLRVAGEGNPGEPGAPQGDLFVKIVLEEDPFFTRDGADIICEVPISIVEATLGGSVRVPSIDGVVDLTIKEGTQNGAQLRMRGMGLPRPGGNGKGDEIVKIQVEVPCKLNAAQRDLLRKLGGDFTPEMNPIRAAFAKLLDRLRSFGRS